MRNRELDALLLLWSWMALSLMAYALAGAEAVAVAQLAWVALILGYASWRLGRDGK